MAREREICERAAECVRRSVCLWRVRDESEVSSARRARSDDLVGAGGLDRGARVSFDCYMLIARHTYIYML